MKRTPLRPGKPPERKTPLERTTRMKAVNARRRAERFQAGFGSELRVLFVQGLPCAACGRVPSENAHVRSRGAGGGPEDVAPLCGGPEGCHAEQHRIGIRSFEAKHGVDLTEAARQTEAAWREHQNGT